MRRKLDLYFRNVVESKLFEILKWIIEQQN